MEFRNCYEDEAYAAAYAKLEFPGTYYLAFRDLPAIFAEHARRGAALDFGCGTGRSTRFVRELGYQVVGVDIAPEMITQGRTSDPAGDYRLVADGDLHQFANESFALILSAFTFDNIPTRLKKVALLRELARVLATGGCMVNLVSSPDIYRHQWASFSTVEFPENRQARCGDSVKIINTALEDRRPAVDVLWPDEDYRAVYADAGLAVRAVYRPLGRADEPYAWINETKIAPWAIYVLDRAG